MKGIRVATGALLTAAAISGCSLSGSTHQSSNAKATDHSPANVSQMPSGFRNAAVKCINVQGMWFALATTSDGGNGDNLPAGIALAPDPKCTHWGP